jgi:hypothetical protein
MSCPPFRILVAFRNAAVSAALYAAPFVGIGKLTGVAALKLRAISSSALENSEGRSAGNPRHSFPASTAGSQKQLVSTGRQRNAVIGQPVSNASKLNPLPSDRCVSLSTTSTRATRNNRLAALIVCAKRHRNPHLRN